MYDAARLRPPLIVCTILLLMISLCGLIIRPIVGGEKPWHPQVNLKLQSVDEMRLCCRRLAAAERSLDRSKGDKFGLLIGSSTLRRAVEPRKLSTGSRWKWTELTINAAGLQEQTDLAETALGSKLKPDVIIMGGSLLLFSEATILEPDRMRFDVSELLYQCKQNDWSDVIYEAESLAIIPWNYILPNRSHVSMYLQLGLYHCQRDLFSQFGFDLADIYEADYSANVDPPSGPEVPAVIKRARPDANHHLDHQWKRLNVFDPAQICSDTIRFQAFCRMVRHARAQNSEVIIVFLPLMSTMRDQLPARGLEILQAKLRQALGSDAPRIIDMRADMSDDDFRDYHHLTYPTRDRFTRMFSERIRPELP
jgi:hypothetical protein